MQAYTDTRKFLKGRKSLKPGLGGHYTGVAQKPGYQGAKRRGYSFTQVAQEQKLATAAPTAPKQGFMAKAKQAFKNFFNRKV